MPYKHLALQLFAEEASAETTDTGVVTGVAENVSTDGVATGDTTEQIATAPGDESWDSLIKGKYKDDYAKSIQAAIDKRFKNQRNLQGQIDMIDPMIRQLAARYDIKPNPDGSIPIDALTNKVFDDDSLYEQEAFNRGMSVKDYKEFKALERENQMLKLQNTRSAERQEWDMLVQQGEKVKEMYPDFDLESEMNNPQFGRLLSTLQGSGFPDAVRTAYETVHKDEIMGGAMRYSVQKAQEKLTNSVQANMARPTENGIASTSTANVGAIDPSRLTKAQIDDLKRRAERGERITFS